MARHEDILRAIRVGIFGPSGLSDEALRRAVFEGDDETVPEAARPYLTKVREHAYRITDEDIAGLKAAGLSEDEIYDLTIVAAFGASWKRLDAGWRALRGGRS